MIKRRVIISDIICLVAVILGFLVNGKIRTFGLPCVIDYVKSFMTPTRFVPFALFPFIVTMALDGAYLDGYHSFIRNKSYDEVYSRYIGYFVVRIAIIIISLFVGAAFICRNKELFNWNVANSYFVFKTNGMTYENGAVIVALMVVLIFIRLFTATLLYIMFKIYRCEIYYFMGFAAISISEIPFRNIMIYNNLLDFDYYYFENTYNFTRTFAGMLVYLIICFVSIIAIYQNKNYRWSGL
ncbi:MAG: hypothetical protein SPL99_01020 [Catonella sp.]|nr:hypothetical protein [Catonella sp.]MDY6356314.1 hypothetical protein [Catonella sp.]